MIKKNIGKKKKIIGFKIFNKILSIPKVILLGFVSLGSIFPIYYMIANSLKTKIDYINNRIGLPSKIIWDNYRVVLFEKSFFSWTGNTLILTFSSVILVIFISMLAAYSFAKMNFKMKNKLLLVIISLMVIPPVVMIIPLFVLTVKVHLINNFISPILIYTGLMMPFSIYLLVNFFKTIPDDFIDAAVIDGCTTHGILFRIIFPLSKAPIVTLFIVNAMWVWNELLIAMIFLQKEGMRTMNQVLADLCNKGAITLEASQEKSVNVDELYKLIKSNPK